MDLHELAQTGRRYWVAGLLVLLAPSTPARAYCKGCVDWPFEEGKELLVLGRGFFNAIAVEEADPLDELVAGAGANFDLGARRRVGLPVDTAQGHQPRQLNQLGLYLDFRGHAFGKQHEFVELRPEAVGAVLGVADEIGQGQQVEEAHLAHGVLHIVEVAEESVIDVGYSLRRGDGAPAQLALGVAFPSGRPHLIAADITTSDANLVQPHRTADVDGQHVATWVEGVSSGVLITAADIPVESRSRRLAGRGQIQSAAPFD